MPLYTDHQDYRDNLIMEAIEVQEGNTCYGKQRKN